jgi:mannose/cellobiose epimerase-like protein (N-acyl-D-glucosamine 2-epimerase family)
MKHEARQPAEAARKKVLRQHEELRRLLTMGLAEARVAVTADGAMHETLRSLMTLIRDVFVGHLADEEALIVPILEADPPAGPLRVAALRAAHAQQRAELDALCAWPEEASDPELEERFDQLAKLLLEDIADEEHELLVPEVIHDDEPDLDQPDG